MIHALGDSHALYSFQRIPEVAIHHLGPITMHRVGHPEETLLADAVAAIGVQPRDVLIFCFGEIDVRCHVKLQLERSAAPATAVLGELASRYLAKLEALAVTGARLAVLSVVPPVPAERAVNPLFPVAGTVEERAAYTVELNRLLAAQCGAHNLLFVDVHGSYVDQHGCLRPELSDGCVHILDTYGVRQVLAGMGLLEAAA